MADKIENFEDLFSPLRVGAHYIFDSEAVAYLDRQQVNMAQEIIQRFGLLYPQLLKQALTGEENVSKNLEKRVSTIKKRYDEILKKGSSCLEKTLTDTSSLSGRSADEITNNYWTILKYLPMASEALYELLLCSPENAWNPLLRASFENFQRVLSEEIKEGTSQLFNLTDQSTELSCARKVLLSRAAFPSAPEKFTPFLIVFAEWLAYNPNPTLSRLCKLLNISESFLREKSTALREEVAAYDFPPNLNFCAFLAFRSASIFCKNTNLRLSQNGMQKLMHLFLQDELLRSAWTFFSASQELQKLKPSDKTLLLPHHLLICFWDLKSKIPGHFTQHQLVSVRCFLHEENLELSSDKALSLLSSLFEWLILASTQDQERFFADYAGYRVIRLLTTIQDLKELTSSSENTLKAFLLFMTHYESLSNIAGNCVFFPFPPASLIYKWILEATPSMQEQFFKTADAQFPEKALKHLENVRLPDHQMLPVLTFLFREREAFISAIEFIDDLPLNDSAKQELKQLFLQYIYEEKGNLFLKIRIQVQQLFSDLACKRFPQSVEGDEERREFYRICAPIFVWCIKGNHEARGSLFDIGTAFRLEPLLRSLEIMRDVHFPEEKKLLLWIGILPHLKYFPDVLSLIDSLQNANLRETFFNALCDLEVDWFFTVYLTFLKFKASVANADYVFEWMVEAPQKSRDDFSSFLDTTLPQTLTSSLSLIAPLKVDSKKRLEILTIFAKYHTFFSGTFAKLRVFSKPEANHDIEQAFLDRYIEEIGYIRLHNTEQEEIENTELCAYVTENLRLLEELVTDFSFPSQRVLMALCFDPLTKRRLHTFKSFLSPFWIKTEKTPAIYETLLNFIKNNLKQDHIDIVRTVFTRLDLFQLSYDIFAIMNAFKPESVDITIAQARIPFHILSNLTKECLNPFQAVVLFALLLKEGDDLSNKKIQTLQLFEETTAVYLNGDDTFEWMMKYPGDDDFLTELKILNNHRKTLEEYREQPSLPIHLCQSISDCAAKLNRRLDSYNMEELATLSLKKHISTALILFELPCLFDFFCAESVQRQDTTDIPLDPRYPLGKKIKLQWKTPLGEKKYPKLVILGYSTLEIELSIAMEELQCYSQILHFTHTLLQDCGKEQQALTGDFINDFDSFSNIIQAEWKGAELHKTDTEKTALGKAIYKFVLQIKIALRKRRHVVSREN